MRPLRLGSIFLPAIVCIGAIAVQPSCSRQASEPTATATAPATSTPNSTGSWIAQAMRKPVAPSAAGTFAKTAADTKSPWRTVTPIYTPYRMVTPTLRDGKAPHGPTLRAAMIQATQANSDIRYAAVATAADTVRADSIEQQLSTTINPNGAQVSATKGTATHNIHVRLNNFGCEKDAGDKLATAKPQLSDGRVRLSRGDVVEWYQNGSLGIEQGFDLKNRPSCRGDERDDGVVLSLDLELQHGHGLTAQLMENRGEQWIEVRDAAGSMVLHYSDLYAEDATGKPLPAKMQLANAKLTLHINDNDATYPLTVDPLIWAEIGPAYKQPAGDAAAGDQFGFAIAVSGDHAVIGAPFDDEGGSDAGAGAIFMLSGQGVWTQQLKILGNEAGGQFGASVAIDDIGGGNKRVIFGAPNDTDMGTVLGSATWFVGRGNSFALDASFGSFGNFGTSVAVSGNNVVIGAPTTTTSDGLVVILQPAPALTPPWIDSTYLPGAFGTGETFGQAVAVENDTAVIGAPAGNGGTGIAYVYERDPMTAMWAPAAGSNLIASDGLSGDQFGSSVALSGLSAIVGAPNANSAAGAAYVFLGSVGIWTQQAKLHTATGISLTAGDRFGASVDIVGNLAAVGAPGKSTGASGVYVLNRSGSSFTLDATGKVTPAMPTAGEFFGASVSIDSSGSRILVGATGNGGDGSGAFYEIIQRKQNGDPCLAQTECASEFCVDGVCCNSACGGGTDSDCQTCLMAKGATADGTCGTTKSGVVCNPANGVCDVAETCNGISLLCPADVFQGPATTCRAAVGTCDIAESCTGSSANCPTDTLQATGFVCRGSAGACDQKEVCDGLNGACPGDIKAPSGTVCRAANGLCDAQEVCDGTTDLCPTDTFAASTTVCRAAAGFCDQQELCTGTGPACPTDTFIPAASNTVCRATAGPCDQQEICNGSGPNCPTDTFLSSATVCRPAVAGGCDMPESCTGSAAACPADQVATVGTICRAAAGPCDQKEVCNGKSGACPGDIKAPSGTTCRLANGVCDATEYCDGAADACPTDTFLPSTTVCRPTAGICDTQETCTGSAAACPTDTFVMSGTVCRPAIAGGCDMPEACTGAAAACPTDAVATVGTVCRAAAGPCDQKEVCNGSNGICPGDIKVPSGVVCRGSAGICDVAEACDGIADACPTDSFVTMGTVCRASAGICDVQESCTGAAAACPPDTFVSAASNTVCRPAIAGGCDMAETCSGSAAVCPTDVVATTGTVCRAAAGPCDQKEVCNGSNGICPGDIKVPTGVVCRGSAGICDVAEACDGIADACPSDSFVTMGTVCRASAGICDVQESCTGAAAACPTDTFVANTVTCRMAAGNCDVAENCTGAAAACPVDSVQAFGTMCRPSAGRCDVAESCDGASGVCPGDSKVPNGVTCRSSSGICDLTETCDGVANDCPVDSFVPSGTTCRPSSGNCDPLEACTGLDATCPADVLRPSGYVCRPSAGICDQTEMCDGLLGDCPDDAKVPSGTICRASTGVCDPDEICDGRTNTCAADAMASDGTLCPGGTCQTALCRAEADLVVAAAASPGYSGPTSTLGYTLGVGNIGRSPTTLVVLTLTVPSGTDLITQGEDGSSGDGWTCRKTGEDNNGVEIECTRPTLGVGENTLVAVGLRPPAGAEKVDLSANVSSAVFDPVLSNNSAMISQSLLSERYAGGGIGCSAAPVHTPVSSAGWLFALFGALTLTFRRRRSS